MAFRSMGERGKEKQIGVLWRRDLAETVKGLMAKIFVSVLGWKEDEYERFAEHGCREYVGS